MQNADRPEGSKRWSRGIKGAGAMRLRGRIAHDAHHIGERHLARGRYFGPHFGGSSVGCALTTAASFLSRRHASILPIYFRSTLELAAIFGHCLRAGMDAPNHLLELDDAGVRILMEKNFRSFRPSITWSMHEIAHHEEIG